jgi:hypothetical protein
VTLDRTLYEIRVKETDRNREYWVSRPWLADRRDEVREAAILIVPWENFRNEEATLFPRGTTDVAARIREVSGVSVAIAVDRLAYKEIMLHSKEHRLPTIFVREVLLPTLVGILATLAADAVMHGTPNDTVEVSVIVEGEQGRCISVEYKGPATRLAETVVKETERCLPPKLPVGKVSPTGESGE